MSSWDYLRRNVLRWWPYTNGVGIWSRCGISNEVYFYIRCGECVMVYKVVRLPLHFFASFVCTSYIASIARLAHPLLLNDTRLYCHKLILLLLLLLCRSADILWLQLDLLGRSNFSFQGWLEGFRHLKSIEHFMLLVSRRYKSKRVILREFLCHSFLIIWVQSFVSTMRGIFSCLAAF